jgi:hypothetical protein
MACAALLAIGTTLGVSADVPPADWTPGCGSVYYEPVHDPESAR